MRHHLQLSNGAELAIESARQTERDVSDVFASDQLAKVLPAISGLCDDILSALRSAKPDRATVEFGIKLEFETSRLLAVLCSANAAADLKLTLEWASASSRD